jgi:voltage-gated potassium channel
MVQKPSKKEAKHNYLYVNDVENIADWVFDKLFYIASHTKLTALLYLINFTACTLAFTAIENKPLDDAIWWIVTTWFTVGYGDLYPLTHNGKLLAIYTIISSHVLIILLTANFISKLSLYRKTKKPL